MTDKLIQHLSRRKFLRDAAGVWVASSSFGALRLRAAQGKVCAYVGTYTTAVDGGGDGEGIYLFDMDSATGELSNRRLAAKTPNPSWIAIHPSKKFLYAINEVANYEGGNGSVSSFVIDAATGNLTLLNAVSSAGAGPAHLSLDATGSFAFVANYAGGTIAVLPILANGRLGEAIDVHRDTGPLLAAQTTDARPIAGHKAPHAHMIAADPNSRFVLATDLGLDRLYVYRFDSTSGKLTQLGDATSLPSGDGPRHFAFHPNGRWLYLLEEESSKIVSFEFNLATGALTAPQSISALPQEFAGISYGSEIQLSPNGRFLLSANRLHDTISICSIGGDGRPKLIGEVSTLGDYPRHFAFDPSGNYLFVCDQRSDCITSFRVQRETGMLAFTGQYTAVGSPAMIAFLA
jgi:6-phosphogluconolactonase (cycloisomerase 2 family)